MIKEIIYTIGQLKPNKSLGPDGLSAELYKNFKLQLAPHLQRLFHTCMADNRMPQSWKEAKIIIPPKPNRNIPLMQSYMPISLLSFLGHTFTFISLTP